MKRALALVLLLAVNAQAEYRVDLITKLNQILDDAEDRKASQANKIDALDYIGREYGRMGFYVRRDTILTSLNAESYSLNSDSDYAGGVEAVWLKREQEQINIPVIDRDSAFRIANVAYGVISYAYIDPDKRLGTVALANRQDTLIVLKWSFPPALSGDSVRWALDEGVQDAALFDAAAVILAKIPLSWARAKRQECVETADRKLARFIDPPSKTRQVGISER